ncbi:MAG: hypothetical protein MSIBF_03050 [Candidatus Altiarchaeales archaeon IMC4]|nr:MAG: hypothetical protein MSIBF_03050 [Candidatus Altiarchaeales archaeon IMC4]
MNALQKIKANKFWIARVVFAALLITFVFKNFAIIPTIQNAKFDMVYLLLSGIFYTTALLIVSSRWNFMVKRITGACIPFAFAAKVFIGTLFVSDFTPARAGDLGRAVLLKRGYEVPLANGTLSVIIDRLNDLIFLSLFSIIGCLLLLTTIDETFFLIPLLVIILSLSVLITLKPQLLSFPLKFFGRFLPGLNQNIEIRRYNLQIPIVLTAVSWIFHSLCVWAVFASLGFSVNPALLFLILPLIRMSALIPVTVAGLGVFELFATFVYHEVFYIPVGICATIAILERIITTGVHVAGALIYCLTLR